VLKPDGIFVMYNYLRQGWIVERIAAMAERTFGCPPLILSLPYEETLRTSSPAGFTMIIAATRVSPTPSPNTRSSGSIRSRFGTSVWTDLPCGPRPRLRLNVISSESRHPRSSTMRAR
jgi:hypothetical protein